MAKKNEEVDLFATAPTKTKTTASKSDQKEMIIVDKVDVAKALTEFEEANKIIKDANAKKAAAEAIIKAYGKDAFISKYEKSGKRPESFILSEMIQKYGKQISKAIVDCKDIPADDKKAIIERTESYSIKKGTIDNMKDLAKLAKTTISAIFAEIFPTQQLKGRGEK